MPPARQASAQLAPPPAQRTRQLLFAAQLSEQPDAVLRQSTSQVELAAQLAVHWVLVPQSCQHEVFDWHDWLQRPVCMQNTSQALLEGQLMSHALEPRHSTAHELPQDLLQLLPSAQT